MLDTLRVLGWLHAQGLVGRALGCLALFTLSGTLAATLLVGWEGDTLVFCGVPQEEFGQDDRERTLQLFLGEMASWAWVGWGLFYIVPVVLLPLATSFSISQVLWLRMTPASARLVAVSRALRPVLAGLLIAALTASAALACAVYHGANPRPVLLHVAGLVGHLLFSGGIVLVAGEWMRHDRSRAVLALVAFLVPVLSFLVALIVGSNIGRDLDRWWPYASPFVYLLGPQERHYVGCAAGGAILILASIVVQPARLVRGPALEECEA